MILFCVLAYPSSHNYYEGDIIGTVENEGRKEMQKLIHLTRGSDINTAAAAVQ